VTLHEDIISEAVEPITATFIIITYSEAGEQ
jgi:hypothetical protein